MDKADILNTTDYSEGVFSMSLLEKWIVENGHIRWTEEIDEADLGYWEDLHLEKFKGNH